MKRILFFVLFVNELLLAKPETSLVNISGVFLVQSVKTFSKGNVEVRLLKTNQTHEEVFIFHPYSADQHRFRLKAKVQIKASAIRVSREIAELVVYYYPNKNVGPVPVVLQSRKHSSSKFSSSRFLDLHSPVSDYGIF